MVPERIRIDDRISYWKATKEPLSSDIGVIEGDEYTWIFDVGFSEEAVACVQSIQGPKNIVLSHFHSDHTANWSRVTFQNLYQGKHTLKYTHCGEVVSGDLWIKDGIELHLFELPTSHAKGSIGLEINGKYAFLGDAAYCAMKNGKQVYNANRLAEEIKVLRGLKAEYVLLSHRERFMCKKKVLLVQLETIYAKRDAHNGWVEVG